MLWRNIPRNMKDYDRTHYLQKLESYERILVLLYFIQKKIAVNLQE